MSGCLNKLTMHKNTNNRSYSLSKKPGELWRASCYDSYGEYSENYFETEERANKWIYWRWENEDFFQQDSEKILADAIWGCHKLDKELGILKGNRDGLD